MMNDNLQVCAQSSPWWDGGEFLVGDKPAPGGIWHIVRELVLEKVPEAVRVGPTFRLSRDAAQTLMDDLWASGIRPSEVLYPQGGLKAMKEHLKDLRRIVFEKGE